MPASLPTHPWISCPRPAPAARLRLWCLPFAGGGASVWHPWAAPLAPDIEVIAFRPPGRESRLVEPPIADPATLVEALVHTILPHTQSHYALLGHSLGGLLAFAVTRELLTRGAPPPRALVASGIRAPHLPRTEPELHALPDGELISELDLRYGGIPPALREDRELLTLFLPALRADLRVYETFPLASIRGLPVPILALGGEADPVVSRNQVLAWREHTSVGFAAEFFPGGHFFLQTEFPAVAHRVRSFLAAPARDASDVLTGAARN
jgi:medium-chain acyl-[acyl-carrier-protein] hydrolase